MNIAVIDDVKLDRKKLIACLQKYFTENFTEICLNISEFKSGEEFIESFNIGDFDFIFTDCYMSGISGLETAKRVRQIDSAVILIFTTASSEYAIDSYKVKASGYLLKPYGYNDIAEIISLIDLKGIDDKRFIEIPSKFGTLKLVLKDILYCDMNGHYVQIHTKSLGIQKARMSFSQILKLLEPYREFLICYRGCIINLEHVKSMDRLNFIMDNDEYIPFRKREYMQLAQNYSDFIFEKMRCEESRWYLS